MRRSRTIDFFIEFAYLGIIFLIPLFFNFFFPAANPFELYKASLFKILFWLLLFLFVLKSSFDFRFLRKSFELIKKYFYVFFIFILLLLLTNIFSVNRTVSFFGSLDRQLGYFTYLYFLSFALIVASFIFYSQVRFKKIFNIILAIISSGTIVSLYAIFQYAGVDFLTWEEPAIITKRAFSSLGQPNFLGSFLLLVIPLTAYLFSIEKIKDCRIIFSFLLLIQILALVFSGSRGAWVALILSLILFFSIFYFKNNKKLFYGGQIAVLLLLLFLFVGNFNVNQRFKTLANLSQGSTLARSLLWQGASDFALKNPLGLGMENQREALVRYSSPDWVLFSKVNTIFDRAHNVFLDILLSGGVLALLAWLFFYSHIFKRIFNNLKAGSKNGFLFKFIFLGITAYLISLFFNFSTFVTELYFWTILVIIIALSFSSSEPTEPESLEEGEVGSYDQKRGFKVVGVFISLLFFILTILMADKQIRALRSDYYFVEANNYFFQGEAPAAALTFSYFREKPPVHNNYYYQFIAMVFSNFEQIKDESARFLLLEEVEEINNILKKRELPKVFEYNISRARSEALLKNFSESKKFLDLAKEQSPLFSGIALTEAKVATLEDNFFKAKEIYLSILDSFPEEKDIDGDINLNSLKNFKRSLEHDLLDLDNRIIDSGLNSEPDLDLSSNFDLILDSDIETEMNLEFAPIY